MIFRIFPSIIDKYPKLKIGIISVKDIDNSGSDQEIFHLLEEIEDYIKLNFIPEELAKNPLISPWQTVYQEFGSKPKSYKSSVEAMMVAILKGEAVPRTNKLLDICRYISLKHLVPLGCYDLDLLQNPISLKHAEGVEAFVPLGSDVKEKAEKGEVIYSHDVKRVISRRWNWKDSELTKVTEKTRNAVIFIDGLAPVTKSKLNKILEELSDLINSFCNGKTKVYIANKDSPSVEF